MCDASLHPPCSDCQCAGGEDHAAGCVNSEEPAHEYAIWIVVEPLGANGDPIEGGDIDLPFGRAATRSTVQEAIDFATELQDRAIELDTGDDH